MERCSARMRWIFTNVSPGGQDQPPGHRNSADRANRFGRFGLQRIHHYQYNFGACALGPNMLILQVEGFLILFIGASEIGLGKF